MTTKFDAQSQTVFPMVAPPMPFGARVVDGGVQFSIFSRHATRVWLLLFDDAEADGPTQELELDPKVDRIGDVWHRFVPSARAGMFYVYRMEGRRRKVGGRRYRADQWLLDPYALAVAGSPTWGDSWGLRPGEQPASGARFPKGVIVDDDFDWTGDVPPRIPMRDTVIYELNPRGYTAHASAGVQHPGTYLGLIEKIPYIKDLGVTAVELMPTFEFNEMEYRVENHSRRELRNYWGYSTMAFFAPNGRHAAGGVHGQQVREFKELVKAFHAAGIEVILDVVYNHTAEGGRSGPTYSFRGIDNSIYYMMERDGSHYANYSGCGNTVNCNHPVVRNMILDSLRYWVGEMHVDGFRFDLATILTRDQDGTILADPPLVDQIAEDPLLRHAKLIAEAWDAVGAYQVGSFPNPHWAEWNGRFRDDVRRYWRGDPGMLGAFAQRITGSADMYNRDDLSPLKTINYVTCHDGFTLHDLVSYTHKRNDANMENNRDGEKHNHSWNCGQEGPSDDTDILQRRKRCMKNLIATVMLSQGVPMILAGDEFGSTQHGNNNAYCQDNDQVWTNWSLVKAHDDLIQFTRKAITFRERHVALRRARFFRGAEGDRGWADIKWFGPTGDRPDWHHGSALGCLMSGEKEHTGATQTDDTLFVIYNAGADPLSFCVPAAPGKPWRTVLFTEEKRPAWETPQEIMRVDAVAVLVLASAASG